MRRATFDDVNLCGAQVHNVALTNAAIRDAYLGNVTIEGAGYEEMRTEGILVTDLLRVYLKPRAANALHSD